MKLKYLLIVLKLLFVFSGAKAQDQSFIGGLLLNFNGIQFEGENEVVWNSTTGTIWGAGGISVGAFVKREFSEKFYSAFELRYIQKGSIYEFANQYGNRSLELLKLHYMELPLLFGWKIYSGKKIFFLETGLAWSRMFDSRMAFNRLVERIKTPNAENFRGNDFSFVLASKVFLNQKKNLLLGLRTEYSLFSIHKNYNLHNLVYGIELDYQIFSR